MSSTFYQRWKKLWIIWKDTAHKSSRIWSFLFETCFAYQKYYEIRILKWIYGYHWFGSSFFFLIPTYFRFARYSIRSIITYINVIFINISCQSSSNVCSPKIDTWFRATWMLLSNIIWQKIEPHEKKAANNVNKYFHYWFCQDIKTLN